VIRGLRVPLLAAALVLATIAVYAPVRHHEFLAWDDDIYVTRNPNLERPLDAEAVARAFREPYESNWIPLTWLSLHVDRALFGADPGAFHLVNLGLHALGALLLFAALARMTGAPGRSFAVAAVFAVHPLHVESVAWVAERKDVLAGVFFGAVLLLWARYAERPGALRYAAVAAALAAGLLAKPVLAPVPLLLLLLDSWPLRRLAGRRRVRRALLEKLPLLALSAAAGAAAYAAQSAAGSVARTIPLDARIANALRAIPAYVGQAVWPRDLAFFYPHPEPELLAPATLAAGACVLAVTALTVWQARARPHLLVGWLWFTGLLLPVLGLVQVGLQARADRYTYLPLAGLALALVWELGARWPRARVARAAGAAAGGTALLALAIVARAQVHVWSDSRTLFAHAVEVTEDNYLAHRKLADTLLAEGELEGAEAHYEKALALRPRWVDAHVGLAEVLRERGRADAARARLRLALSLAPDSADAHARLGRALLEEGDAGRALVHLRRALRAGAGLEEADVRSLLGAALLRTGRAGEAVVHLEAAVAERPRSADLRASLGMALVAAGRPREADPHLERALAARLDDPELRHAAGEAARAGGRPAEAARHYRTALAARPGFVPAANNLAWLLATSDDPELRDPAEAVRVAESAGFGGSERPQLLDTLAAAYAAAGRSADAVAVAERARELARARGDAELANAIGARLARYREEAP